MSCFDMVGRPWVAFFLLFPSSKIVAPLYTRVNFICVSCGRLFFAQTIAKHNRLSVGWKLRRYP